MFGVQLHSIRDTWRHNLEKFPSKAAYVHEGRTYSYAETDLLSDRLRRAMAEQFGLRKGDKVAIAAPNGIEYTVAYWAAVKHGAVVVPVNVRLGAEEIRHVLSGSESSVLVAHAVNWRAVQDPLKDCPDIKGVIGVGVAAPGVAAYEELVAGGGPFEERADITEYDLAILMHTSGTTGRPKAAMMRHGDLLFNNMIAIYAHSLRHEDVHLLVIPMYHPTATYSLLPSSALLGSTIVLAPRAEPRAIAELIQAHRVTTFFGVPTLFRLLLSLKDLDAYDLGSLRLIAYAGSTMPADTIRDLRRRFPRVTLHNFFGLTETISMTHVLPGPDADIRPDSIGKVLPHVRQAILDESGRPVPRGAVGELHFHRNNVISGYWKEPERLAQSMRGEWFNTGDLAALDEEGYVYLKGRSKDMIIVGGENVYSLEVENCIMTLPGVLEAAVVGVPATGARSALGELVKAVVVPRPGADLDEADIKRHCMERLATYKVPQIIEFRSELPRNPGGKIMRRLLK